jgi:hypothetical protein
MSHPSALTDVEGSQEMPMTEVDHQDSSGDGASPRPASPRRSVTGSDRARGMCPECGQEMSLTDDGTMMRHAIPRTAEVCPGSKQSPARTVAQ